ncbi:hypothetical protein Agub_g8031, partial [Astrephomene gubernaculifera]
MPGKLAAARASREATERFLPRRGSAQVGLSTELEDASVSGEASTLAASTSRRGLVIDHFATSSSASVKQLNPSASGTSVTFHASSTQQTQRSTGPVPAAAPDRPASGTAAPVALTPRASSCTGPASTQMARVPSGCPSTRSGLSITSLPTTADARPRPLSQSPAASNLLTLSATRRSNSGTWATAVDLEPAHSHHGSAPAPDVATAAATAAAGNATAAAAAAASDGSGARAAAPAAPTAATEATASVAAADTDTAAAASSSAPAAAAADAATEAVWTAAAPAPLERSSSRAARQVGAVPRHHSRLRMTAGRDGPSRLPSGQGGTGVAAGGGGGVSSLGSGPGGREGQLGRQSSAQPGHGLDVAERLAMHAHSRPESHLTGAQLSTAVLDCLPVSDFETSPGQCSNTGTWTPATVPAAAGSSSVSIAAAGDSGFMIRGASHTPRRLGTGGIMMGQGGVGGVGAVSELFAVGSPSMDSSFSMQQTPSDMEDEAAEHRARTTRRAMRSVTLAAMGGAAGTSVEFRSYEAPGAAGAGAARAMPAGGAGGGSGMAGAGVGLGLGADVGSCHYPVARALTAGPGPAGTAPHPQQQQQHHPPTQPGEAGQTRVAIRLHHQPGHHRRPPNRHASMPVMRQDGGGAGVHGG